MSLKTQTVTKSLDWVTIFLFLGLATIGWLMLYASIYEPGEPVLLFSTKSIIGIQTIWIAISMVAFWLCLYIDWKIWNTFAYVFYGLALLSLIMVLLIGVEIKGARSWFRFGSVSFQPAEFAKLATALALASFLSNYKTDLRQIKSQVIALVIMLFPSFLIILQPDAGSALIFFSFAIVLYREGLSPIYYQIAFSLLFTFILTIIYDPFVSVSITILLALLIYIMQLDRKFIYFMILSVGTISMYFLWPHVSRLGILGFLIIATLGFSYFMWTNRYKALVGIIVPALVLLSSFAFGTNYMFNNFLKPHQQDRINVWLKPHLSDPQGSLYNINQSKTAIGSGGLLGKGFLKGIMTEGNHVPEQTTDFIFSTLGEEQGFVGVLSVIALFSLLMYRIYMIGERARNLFIRRYAYGVMGIIFFHFFINIGMNMGLAPVIGIPLPFISKGGTALFFFAIMIGILVKMDMSRVPE